MAEGTRRSRWWILLVFLIGMFFLPVMGAVLLVRAVGQGETLESGTVLALHLKGDIPEAPLDPFLAKFGGAGDVSMWEVRRKLRLAAKDDRIVGLKLTIEPTGMGFGVAEEIVAELDRFRASGKPVHAFLSFDIIEEKDLFLATGADRVWMLPGTAGLINGFVAEVTFWRGTLDKLHIEPEVIMFKEYKSAGEPMQNYEMSPYFRESLTALLGDIDARFRARVTSRRNIELSALSAMMDEGLLSSERMKAGGLIDEIGYLDELDAVLLGAAGVEDPRFVSMSDYGSDSPERVTGKAAPDVAVIFAGGPISATSGPGANPFGGNNSIYGPVTAKQISRAIDNDAVKAIVLRVDSPGGSAVGSDMIWRETQRAQDAGKPVIISMGSYAASGGYWISMGANAIVAQPTTITGSIGVIFQKFNVEGFMEMIGANVDEVLTAPNAQLFSLSTPLSEERRAQVTEWIGGTYDAFTTKVSQGRNLPIETVREIARGRVWSGEDALERGLVDRLGGLEEAIALAKERASLPVGATAEPFPGQKSFIEQLVEGDFSMVKAAYGVSGLPGAEAALPFSSREGLKAYVEEVTRPEVRAIAPDIQVH